MKGVVFDEMSAALELDVILKVDAKWAYTWGDMEARDPSPYPAGGGMKT